MFQGARGANIVMDLSIGKNLRLREWIIRDSFVPSTKAFEKVNVCYR